MAMSPGNAEYFHIIDTAMFVLCLDDGCPETPEEKARQGYIGNGFNRWFDKVLQFYVSTNGRSGFITEHGGVDGTTPARLQESIGKAIEENTPSSRAYYDQPNGSMLSDVQFNVAVLQATPEIESHIEVLRSRFLEYTAPATTTYVKEHLTEFGTDFLMRHKVAAKGVIDLTYQLALRLFFGRSMPSWEPVSAAHYHTGRSDAVQRATPAVVAFCDAVAKVYKDRDYHNNEDHLETLLSAATKQMNASMRDMLNGRSYLRVMELLAWLWPSNSATPKPRFLSEHIFFGRPFPPIFVQSNAIETDMPVEELVHVMPSPDGFWAIMVPEKNE
jgi:hypothetical protein